MRRFWATRKTIKTFIISGNALHTALACVRVAAAGNLNLIKHTDTLFYQQQKQQQHSLYCNFTSALLLSFCNNNNNKKHAYRLFSKALNRQRSTNNNNKSFGRESRAGTRRVFDRFSELHRFSPDFVDIFESATAPLRNVHVGRQLRTK